MVRHNEADDKVTCEGCTSVRVEENEDGRSLCAICEMNESNNDN